MIDYTALSRGEWLALADRFYAQLRRSLDLFTPVDWERRTRYLGWRSRDTLAHMASAIPVNFRQVLDRALAGNATAPPEFDTFSRNGREVARRRSATVTDLRQEFDTELASILSIYRGMTDDDWLRPGWFFVGRVNVRTLFLAQFADNVVHERDLLLPVGRWQGFAAGADWVRPLVDWFLRELRPALFRPDRAVGLKARVLYKFTGSIDGEWTLVVADGSCSVELGQHGTPDIVVESDAEDLVASAQARAAPWVGGVARLLAWTGGAHAERAVARITGVVALTGALLQRRLVVHGDRKLARRLTRAFWHFWQRTEMTELNITRG